jgi:hypothetical protein
MLVATILVAISAPALADERGRAQYKTIAVHCPQEPGERIFHLCGRFPIHIEIGCKVGSFTTWVD